MGTFILTGVLYTASHYDPVGGLAGKRRPLWIVFKPWLAHFMRATHPPYYGDAAGKELRPEEPGAPGVKVSLEWFRR